MWLQNYLTIFAFAICCYNFKDIEAPTVTVKSKHTEKILHGQSQTCYLKTVKSEKENATEMLKKERMKNNGVDRIRVLQWKALSRNSKYQYPDHEEKPMLQSDDRKRKKIRNER